MGFIYQLLFPNGKSYIGKTGKEDVRKRWHMHRVKSNHSWAVARAIKKHGWDNVKKHVLLEIDNGLLDHYEVKFIDALGTLRPGGYNLTPGGDYNPMDDENVRARHSEAVQSESHRESQSKRAKEWRKDTARSAAWKEANTAAQRKPEARKKRAGISKEGWQDPVIRKKRVDGLAKAFADPQVSKKRKDAAAQGLKSEKFQETVERKRQAKLALLPPKEREKQRKIWDANRESYRVRVGYYAQDPQKVGPAENKDTGR